MVTLKEWINSANPFGAAASALTPGDKKKVLDSASQHVDHEPSESREEEELTKSVPRLQEYAKRKKLSSSATPAEVRLFKLQSKRAEPAKKAVPSYKKGTRFVPKTGVAKLHKGEAVLNKKQASKYRAAGGVLGSGKKEVPSKTRKLVKAAGHEMKKNPPAILAKTKKKSGAAQAEKQRVAILLSKARAAGASIPEKK